MVLMNVSRHALMKLYNSEAKNTCLLLRITMGEKQKKQNKQKNNNNKTKQTSSCQ